MVAAVDVDVLYLLILEQWLQPAHAEERGVDRRGELLFFLSVRRRPADGDLVARVFFENLGDDGPCELALVLAGHRLHPGRGIAAPLLGQPIADVAAQPLDDAVVHVQRPFGRRWGVPDVGSGRAGCASACCAPSRSGGR